MIAEGELASTNAPLFVPVWCVRGTLAFAPYPRRHLYSPDIPGSVWYELEPRIMGGDHLWLLRWTAWITERRGAVGVRARVAVGHCVYVANPETYEVCPGI